MGVQRRLHAVAPRSYLCEHMFPTIYITARNTLLRWADLALALLTLEALRLPDHLFAEPETTTPACHGARHRAIVRVADECPGDGRAPRCSTARTRTVAEQRGRRAARAAHSARS